MSPGSSSPVSLPLHHRAFTLVEMLLVITIISILLAGSAALMRSGTQASSARIGADTLQSLADQARAAAIGRGTEARLLIANNPSDDARYLRMAIVVVAEVEGHGTPGESWTWKPLGGPSELPSGVFYADGRGDVLGTAGNLPSWAPIGRDNVPADVQLGKALEADYADAGSWIALAFDGNGRVINPGLTTNPILAVNIGFLNGATVENPEKFKRYAEGFMIVRSTGRPVRLEDTYEQANF